MQLFATSSRNPVAANVDDGVAVYAHGQARRRGCVRRRLGARCGQGHCLHVGPDAADVGFRGRRRLVDARRPERHRARDCRADDAGTGSEVGRAGVITQEATHTKKVIFHPKMMPVHRDLRSGADRRAAGAYHGGDGDGCVRALPGGLLRAGLSSAGRRHRGGRHAPDQPEDCLSRCHDGATSRRAAT